MNTDLSWNLLVDIQQMWSLPFMVNAFRAGTIVALLAAVIGWFMVLRRQSFAGHTLSVVGFPGASAAVWLGLGAATGYFAFCLAAALVFAAVPAGAAGAGRGYPGAAALIGTVQAVALASGMMFVALYRGFLSGTNALLFGSFLGITQAQVGLLAIVAALVLAALAVIGRPLLFSSIDTDVAGARGVPTRALDGAFLLLLAATVAEVGQLTGALLVFALLVLPAATAQQLTARPSHGLALAVLLALATVWVALFVAYYSPYPLGFWLTSVAFGSYVLAAGGSALAAAAGRRSVPQRAAAGTPA